MKNRPYTIDLPDGRRVCGGHDFQAVTRGREHCRECGFTREIPRPIPSDWSEHDRDEYSALVADLRARGVFDPSKEARREIELARSIDGAGGGPL